MQFSDALVLLYQANTQETATTYYKRNDRFEKGEASLAMRRDLVGLRNKEGEHNCFLNVNVQAISALPALLDIFRHLPHDLKGDSPNVPMQHMRA